MPSSEVMHKFKHGTLHSTSKHGPIVHSRKEAIAIMLSEKRNEDEHGGKYHDAETADDKADDKAAIQRRAMRKGKEK